MLSGISPVRMLSNIGFTCLSCSSTENIFLTLGLQHLQSSALSQVLSCTSGSGFQYRNTCMVYTHLHRHTLSRIEKHTHMHTHTHPHTQYVQETGLCALKQTLASFEGTVALFSAGPISGKFCYLLLWCHLCHLT